MLRCDAATWKLLLAGTLDETRSNWVEEIEVRRQPAAHSPSESEVKASLKATFGRESAI